MRVNATSLFSVFLSGDTILEVNGESVKFPPVEKVVETSQEFRIILTGSSEESLYVHQLLHVNQYC